MNDDRIAWDGYRLLRAASSIGLCAVYADESAVPGAINADATPAAWGISATSAGGLISANTRIDKRVINGPGLVDTVPLPMAIGSLLAGALRQTGAILAGRRLEPGSEPKDTETAARKQRQV